MQIYIFLSDEVNDFTRLTHASSPAHSLQVFLRRLCIFELYHVADVHCVDSPGTQIIADKHLDSALMQ